MHQHKEGQGTYRPIVAEGNEEDRLLSGTQSKEKWQQEQTEKQKIPFKHKTY